MECRGAIITPLSIFLALSQTSLALVAMVAQDATHDSPGGYINELRLKKSYRL